MYIVMPGELEAHSIQPVNSDDTLLFIKPNIPMVPQLSTVQSFDQFEVVVPESWADPDKDRFARDIHDAVNTILISRNTINGLSDIWSENAFQNHDASMAAIPIDKIDESTKPALIIGSGAGCAEKVNESEYTSYASWSARNYWFQPDYLGQCDPREPERFTKMPKKGVIFSPVASPKFLLAYPSKPRYVYFDRGNRLAWRYAEKRGLSDHRPICGHVADMLVNCAIYAGHKKICLLGIDLACATEVELRKYHPYVQDITPVYNYHGELVFTDEIFLTFFRGLQETVNRFPDIEFVTKSGSGLIIEGVPYAPY